MVFAIIVNILLYLQLIYTMMLFFLINQQPSTNYPIFLIHMISQPLQHHCLFPSAFSSPYFSTFSYWLFNYYLFSSFFLSSFSSRILSQARFSTSASVQFSLLSLQGFKMTLPFVMFLVYHFTLSSNQSSEHSRAISLFSSLRNSFLSLSMVGINLSTPFFSSQCGKKKPVTVALLQIKSLTSIFETEGPSKAPQTQIVDSLGIHLSIRPVIYPPIASKQTIASILPAISFSFSSNPAQEEFKIKLAPSFRRISTCSSFLTMLMMLIPSCGINRLSIRPSDEAAAFTITVFAFFSLASYSRAIAVKGFTKLIEACQKLKDYSMGIHQLDLARAYWEQVPELRVGVKATRLLTSPHPIRPPPLAKTTPLPQNPGTQGAFLCSQAP